MKGPSHYGDDGNGPISTIPKANKVELFPSA